MPLLDINSTPKKNALKLTKILPPDKKCRFRQVNSRSPLFIATATNAATRHRPPPAARRLPIDPFPLRPTRNTIDVSSLGVRGTSVDGGGKGGTRSTGDDRPRILMRTTIVPPTKSSKVHRCPRQHRRPLGGTTSLKMAAGSYERLCSTPDSPRRWRGASFFPAGSFFVWE